MGLDLNDDSLKGIQNRVAKMYIDEIFSGLNPENKPKIALFDNKYRYNQMLVEKILETEDFAVIIDAKHLFHQALLKMILRQPLLVIKVVILIPH